MNDNKSSGVPAGWYPDPLGLSPLRWWNGLKWTEQTTDLGAPRVTPEPASTRRERDERDDRAKSHAGNRRPSGRALLQLEPPSSAEVAPGIPEPMPSGRTPAEGASSAPIFTEPAVGRQGQQGQQDRGAGPRPGNQRPPQQGPNRAGIPLARAPRTNHNGAVWTIALFPLLQLVFSLMALSALGGPDGAEAMSPTMMVIWLAPYPVTIALAALDRSILKKAGQPHTAHWLWALLSPPVYLLARVRASMRDSRGGLGPVLVWFLVSPLLLASVIAVPALLIATMPATFSAEVEQSVMSDAALLGANLDVVCPPSPPTVVGQNFTCAATKDSGDIYKVDVSLQRTNGWIAWRVDDWGIYTVE